MSEYKGVATNFLAQGIGSDEVVSYVQYDQDVVQQRRTDLCEHTLISRDLTGLFMRLFIDGSSTREAEGRLRLGT